MLNWTLPIATWFSRNFHCGHRFWTIISYFWRSQRLLRQERCSQWRWWWRKLMRSAVMNFWKKKKKKKKKKYFKKSVHKKSPLWYQTRMFWYFVIPSQSFVFLCAQQSCPYISPTPLPNNVHHIIPFLSSMMRFVCPISEFFLWPTILLYSCFFEMMFFILGKIVWN